MLTSAIKSLYEKISQLQEKKKKMRNYLYMDHAESKKHSKVVRDTLQYLQEEKILNYDYNHGFKKIQNKNNFSIKCKSKILQER